MQVRLDKPELEQYVEEQVKAGRFPNAEAVVEDALVRVMEGDVTLTEEDIAAINLSEEQIDRGEGVDSDEVAARMRRHFGVR